MNRYVYVGPVYAFGRCLSDRWRAETLAPSNAKALSNFKYRFKQDFGYAVGAKIDLPGDIHCVSGFEQMSLDDLDTKERTRGRL